MMRERKKKQKADEKRQRRLERKNAAEHPEAAGEAYTETTDAPNDEDESSEPELENVDD